MRQLVRAGFVALCATGVLLAGCGRPPESAPDAPGGFRSIEADADRRAARADPPSGTEFTFNQAAEFGDGVRFEVASIAAGKASATQTGAEGTDGEIVTAEILITNGSKEDFDAGPVRVWGYYAGVGAPMITDSTDQVGDSFTGTVAPGQRAVARFGFAMPHTELASVTIMMDGGGDEHGIVQFTGAVS